MPDLLRIEIDSVEVCHLTAVGTIPGIVVTLAAARNGPGLGALQNAAGSLSWRAPGSDTFGDPVDGSAGGTFVLCDGEDDDKWIRITVYQNFLESGSQADVALADRYNNGVAAADVTAEEASAGDVLDYSITLRNPANRPATDVSAWLDAACDPRTSLSLDGVAWSRPTESSTMAIPAIAAGESVPIYLRRTVAEGEPADPRQLVFLHFSFLI